MTDRILLVALILTMTGCGKISDELSTGIDGYVTRCIDGTKYILMTTDRGVAITPHIGVDGKPKGCGEK